MKTNQPALSLKEASSAPNAGGWGVEGPRPPTSEKHEVALQQKQYYIVTFDGNSTFKVLSLSFTKQSGHASLSLPVSGEKQRCAVAA